MANARGDVVQTPLCDSNQIRPYRIVGTLGSGVHLGRSPGDASFPEWLAWAVSGTFTTAVVDTDALFDDKTLFRAVQP